MLDAGDQLEKLTRPSFLSCTSPGCALRIVFVEEYTFFDNSF